MDAVKNGDNEEDIKYAEDVLTICILSIVVTAPLGAILISLSGPKLLTKTKKPQVLEGKIEITLFVTRTWDTNKNYNKKVPFKTNKSSLLKINKH